MKKTITIALCFAVFLCVYSCKNQKNNSVQKINPKTTDLAKQSEDRKTALSVISFRKEKSPKPPAIIESDIFIYEHVFKDGKMSKSGDYLGHWIDFKADFTYDYGIYQETKGAGLYHHSFDTGLLLLVDNDISKPPLEYITKFAGDAMVLVGQATYGSNGIQQKLSREMSKPLK